VRGRAELIPPRAHAPRSRGPLAHPGRHGPARARGYARGLSAVKSLPPVPTPSTGRLAAAALPFADSRTFFRLGGFNLPLQPGENVRIMRAFNVLRQYEEHEVASAWEQMARGVLPGGLLVEGTSNPFGSIWAANLLRRVESEFPWVQEALVFYTNFRLGFDPAEFQTILPKNYIHRIRPGEPIFDFFEAWKAACAETIAMKTFGLRQWFAASAEGLRRLLLAAAALMIATGLGFAGLSQFWPLLAVAFVGTMNPSAGDVSVFLPLEHAQIAEQLFNSIAHYHQEDAGAIVGLVLATVGLGLAVVTGQHDDRAADARLAHQAANLPAVEVGVEVVDQLAGQGRVGGQFRGVHAQTGDLQAGDVGGGDAQESTQVIDLRRILDDRYDRLVQPFGGADLEGHVVAFRTSFLRDDDHHQVRFGEGLLQHIEDGGAGREADHVDAGAGAAAPARSARSIAGSG